MPKKKTYYLDGSQEAKRAKAVVDAVRKGDKKPLIVYSDEWIKENTCSEDYEFWMIEKAGNLAPAA